MKLAGILTLLAGGNRVVGRAKETLRSTRLVGVLVVITIVSSALAQNTS